MSTKLFNRCSRPQGDGDHGLENRQPCPIPADDLPLGLSHLLAQIENGAAAFLGGAEVVMTDRAHHFFPGGAQQAQGAGVGLHDLPAFGLHDEDPGLQILQDEPGALLALLQGPAGPAVFADLPLQGGVGGPELGGAPFHPGLQALVQGRQGGEVLVPLVQEGHQ